MSKTKRCKAHRNSGGPDTTALERRDIRRRVEDALNKRLLALVKQYPGETTCRGCYMIAEAVALSSILADDVALLTLFAPAAERAGVLESILDGVRLFATKSIERELAQEQERSPLTATPSGSVH